MIRLLSASYIWFSLMSCKNIEWNCSNSGLKASLYFTEIIVPFFLLRNPSFVRCRYSFFSSFKNTFSSSFIHFRRNYSCLPVKTLGSILLILLWANYYWGWPVKSTNPEFALRTLPISLFLQDTMSKGYCYIAGETSLAVNFVNSAKLSLTSLQS